MERIRQSEIGVYNSKKVREFTITGFRHIYYSIWSFVDFLGLQAPYIFIGGGGGLKPENFHIMKYGFKTTVDSNGTLSRQLFV